MAVSPDGTKGAVGVGRSIVFYSLPDLEVIGCPMDLTVMPDNSEAVEISGVDPVTGQTVTYTLPCGAAMYSCATALPGTRPRLTTFTRTTAASPSRDSPAGVISNGA